MKKLKDFFYDNNDLIVAFAILVVAALLILWRMNAIIEYPKNFIDGGTPQVSEPAGDDDSKDEPDEDDGQAEQPGSDDNGQQDKNQEGDEPSSEEPKELWVDGVLNKNTEVKVSGDSAQAAVQCLIDAGLFEDYAEYQSACDSLGIDHQKVSAGTFTFEKGATKKDIAKAINWS